MKLFVAAGDTPTTDVADRLGISADSLEKVVVTGGLGFIGSHLVDSLLAHGIRVVVIDDCSSGKEANVQRHLGDRRFLLLRKDVCDSMTLSEHFRGAGAVVHLAAIVSVRLSIDNPELVLRVNVNGTNAVLDACRRCDVSNVVFASSAAVYGSQDRLPVREDYPTHPLSPYAASKVWGEALCQSYSSSYGMNAVALRLMNVYGPRRSTGQYAGVMVKFAQAIKEGKPMVIYGDGEQTRDFVHVKDVVDAIVLALRNQRAAGQIFNIGTGMPTSINLLAKLFMRLASKKVEVTHIPARRGEIRYSYADVSRARTVLGYNPVVTLEEGIAEYLDWFVRDGQ